MMTERDIEAGARMAKLVLKQFMTADDVHLDHAAREVAMAVIKAVDHARNPVVIVGDVVRNLTKP